MFVKDPVCGMEVRTEDTKLITHYKGRTYYFDSPQCQHMFEEDPEGFAEVVPEKVYGEHLDRYDGSE